MYFTATSSFWIQQLRPGSFSWIHGLSAFTIVTLSLGLWNARRGRVRAHAGNMIGTYVGLWGAFAGVAVVPSRLVPQAFQANWLGDGVADPRHRRGRPGRHGGADPPARSGGRAGGRGLEPLTGRDAAQR